jgi:hypothetical protein
MNDKKWFRVEVTANAHVSQTVDVLARNEKEAEEAAPRQCYDVAGFQITELNGDGRGTIVKENKP